MNKITLTPSQRYLILLDCKLSSATSFGWKLDGKLFEEYPIHCRNFRLLETWLRPFGMCTLWILSNLILYIFQKASESLQNSSILFPIHNSLGLWLELFLLPENQKQMISELIAQQKIKNTRITHVYIEPKAMKIATPWFFQMVFKIHILKLLYILFL